MKMDQGRYIMISRALGYQGSLRLAGQVFDFLVYFLVFSQSVGWAEHGGILAFFFLNSLHLRQVSLQYHENLSDLIERTSKCDNISGPSACSAAADWPQSSATQSSAGFSTSPARFGGQRIKPSQSVSQCNLPKEVLFVVTSLHPSIELKSPVRFVSFS